MGIKGLRKYFNDEEVSGSHFCDADVELCPGSTLCIDANGFLFWILDDVLSKEGLKLHNREFGGAYDRLSEIVVNEVRNLLESNVQVKFFFDGHVRNRMKEETASRRSEYREAQWYDLWDACQRNRLGQIGQSTMPLPPLSILQFRATLTKIAGIEVIYCAHEADQEIARYCFEGNQRMGIDPVATLAGGSKACEGFFIYGNDSDFLMMKGCPYVPLGMLTSRVKKEDSATVTAGRKSDAKSVRTWIAKEVWCRRLIAEALDMSESQLLEWSILLGNDYTLHFDKDLFDGVAETMSDSDDGDLAVICNTAEELREFVVSRGNDFKLTSSRSAELQEAIEFSRATYNLEDISAYLARNCDAAKQNSPQGIEGGSAVKGSITSAGSGVCVATEQRTKESSVIISASVSTERHVVFPDNNGGDSDYSVSSITSGMSLSKAQIDEIAAFYAQILSTMPEIIKGGAAVLALAFLRDHIEEFPFITDQHREALVAMITLLFSVGPKETVAQVVPSERADSALGAPKWEDICTAHFYQLICQQFIWVGKLESDPNSIPHMLYSGAVFHSLLNNARINARTDTQHTAGATEGQNNSVDKAIGKSKSRRQRGQKGDQQQPPHPPVELKQKKERTQSEGHSDRLPIEEHKEEILKTIEANRVTIIEGETGCGKSSRLPLMLLEEASKRKHHCKMFVSQPRRIAVMGLLQRLRPTLGNKVGMRMGHNVRDDSSETQICFVTTGYLVQLLAHAPHALNDHTYLIIDEVHERSIDGDVICWLAKRVLAIHPRLKLILMSATLTAGLYRSYFSVFQEGHDIPSIFVGARRFPVEIEFVDDIVQRAGASKDPMIARVAKDVLESTKNIPADSEIKEPLLKQQYLLASALIRSRVAKGSAVLVFVSGMGDIVELSGMFEDDPNFIICPVHSEIPIEEQMGIFERTDENKIKLIIATNAAESSLTLPDVDVVICFGSQKSLHYHAKLHIVKLTNCWISKASAIQRAGRTGRVRPGKVFRLYSRSLHDKLKAHEAAEIQRRTLEEVIVKLRSMLEDTEDFNGVIPVLEDLLEPPEVDNVLSSIDYLYRIDMITEPSDNGSLTRVGHLAAGLPVDLSLSRLIVFGILLGVGAEAVIMAAGLALGNSLFEVANPLFHTDPDVYNSVAKRVFLGAHKLDGGTYSEPIMLVRIYTILRHLSDINARNGWAHRFGLRRTQLRQFLLVAKNLVSRVNKCLGDDKLALDLNTVKDPSPDPNRLNRLRLILAWCSDNNLIRLCTHQEEKVRSMTVELGRITETDMEQLMPASISWELKESSKVVYDATFSRPRFDEHELLREIISCIATDGGGANRSLSSSKILIWVLAEVAVWNVSKTVIDGSAATRTVKSSVALTVVDIRDVGKAYDITDAGSTEHVSWMKLLFPHRESLKPETLPSVLGAVPLYVVKSLSKNELRGLKDLRSMTPYSITLLIPSRGKAKLMNVGLQLELESVAKIFCGAEGVCAETISDIAQQVMESKQLIMFPEESLDSKSNGSQERTSTRERRLSSTNQDNALIDDLPLGMRLLNAYCHGYKDRCLRVWSPEAQAAYEAAIADGIDEEDIPDNGADDKVSVKFTNTFPKWEHISQSAERAKGPKVILSNALMPRHSLSAVAVHSGKEYVYAAAHRSLFVGEKAARCDGVTIFPPGCRWFVLAYLCVGINVTKDFQVPIKYSQSNCFENVPGKCVDEPINEDDATLCRRASDLLTNQTRQAVAPCAPLIALVGRIFASWGSETDVVVDSDADSDSASHIEMDDVDDVDDDGAMCIHHSEVAEELLVSSSVVAPTNKKTKETPQPPQKPKQQMVKSSNKGTDTQGGIKHHRGHGVDLSHDDKDAANGSNKSEEIHVPPTTAAVKMPLRKAAVDGGYYATATYYVSPEAQDVPNPDPWLLEDSEDFAGLPREADDLALGVASNYIGGNNSRNVLILGIVPDFSGGSDDDEAGEIIALQSPNDRQQQLLQQKKKEHEQKVKNNSSQSSDNHGIDRLVNAPRVVDNLQAGERRESRSSRRRRNNKAKNAQKEQQDATTGGQSKEAEENEEGVAHAINSGSCTKNVCVDPTGVKPLLSCSDVQPGANPVLPQLSLALAGPEIALSESEDVDVDLEELQRYDHMCPLCGLDNRNDFELMCHLVGMDHSYCADDAMQLVLELRKLRGEIDVNDEGGEDDDGKDYSANDDDSIAVGSENLHQRNDEEESRVELQHDRRRSGQRSGTLVIDFNDLRNDMP